MDNISSKIIEPDFVLELYDSCTPLEKAIDLETIFSFYIFYQKQTIFYSWYNNNINTIRSVDYHSKNNLLNIYSSINPKKMAEYFNSVLNIANIPNIEHPIPKTSIYQYGGNFDETDILNFCLGIIFFIFSPNIINLNFLPKPRNKKNSHHRTTIGGIMIENLSKDLDYDKSNMRLVYCVYIMSKKYIVKIVPNLSAYNNEIAIYQELNEEIHIDNKLDNKIVHMFNHGEIQLSYPLSKTKIVIDKILTFLEPKYTQEIFNLEPKPIKYIVTEFNDSYQSLKTLLPIFPIDQKCVLVNHVINLLYYMNNKYGFCHWDLNNGNILVKNTFDDFKLFDFDMSSTNKNTNYEIFKVIPSIIEEKIVFHKYEHKLLGFYYDLTRLLIGFDISNDQCINFPEIHNLVSRFNDMLLLIPYNSNTDYFEYLQNITIKMYDNDFIKKYIGISQNGGKNDYYQKYLKYKRKYLAKNI